MREGDNKEKENVTIHMLVYVLGLVGLVLLEI